MYWTTELAKLLADAPWPATKEELIEYVNRTSGNPALLENLGELDDDGEAYDSISEIWTEYDPDDGFGEYMEEGARLFTNDGY